LNLWQAAVAYQPQNIVTLSRQSQRRLSQPPVRFPGSASLRLAGFGVPPKRTLSLGEWVNWFPREGALVKVENTPVDWSRFPSNFGQKTKFVRARRQNQPAWGWRSPGRAVTRAPDHHPTAPPPWGLSPRSLPAWAVPEAENSHSLRLDIGPENNQIRARGEESGARSFPHWNSNLRSIRQRLRFCN